MTGRPGAWRRDGAHRGHDGPPVLLLHGYPQTHAMWHLVAPILAERFTVVATDLRGYGDSDKPNGDPEHRRYSKRTMVWRGYARDVRGGPVAAGHYLAEERPRETASALLEFLRTDDEPRGVRARTAA